MKGENHENYHEITACFGRSTLCSAAVNAQVMTVALGSATPQVQFMNWAQEQAQNAAQKRFDVLSDAIKRSCARK